jgi:hypothetical protein
MHTFDLPKCKPNMFKHVAMYRRHILSCRGISHMTSMQENFYLGGDKWLRGFSLRALQYHCTITWRLPGLCRGLVSEIKNLGQNLGHADRHTHSSVYRVAPQLKIQLSYSA